jgi:hypothetical protein
MTSKTTLPRPVIACNNPNQLVLQHSQLSKPSVVGKEVVGKKGFGKKGDDANAKFLADLDTLISLADAQFKSNIKNNVYEKGWHHGGERRGEKRSGAFSLISLRRPPPPQFISKMVKDEHEHSVSLSTLQEPPQDGEENARLLGTTNRNPLSLRSLEEAS